MVVDASKVRKPKKKKLSAKKKARAAAHNAKQNMQHYEGFEFTSSMDLDAIWSFWQSFSTKRIFMALFGVLQVFGRILSSHWLSETEVVPEMEEVSIQNEETVKDQNVSEIKVKID